MFTQIEKTIKSSKSNTLKRWRKVRRFGILLKIVVDLEIE